MKSNSEAEGPKETLNARMAVLLIRATLLEVSGTDSMKLSEGFSRMVSSVLLFFFYAMSFILLVFALKRIEISIAYSVWSGLGTPRWWR